MIFKKGLKVLALLLLVAVLIIFMTKPLFLKLLMHQNIMDADDLGGKVKSSLTYSLGGYRMRIYGHGPMSQKIPEAWKNQLMTLSSGWTINIHSVEVDEGVTYISIGAFVACSSLNSVILPKSLKRIGSRCFSYCHKLEQITYRGNKSDWNQVMRRSRRWNFESSIKEVKCSDGIVQI